MKQREIWMADLNPTKGSEQAGIRPVVILSGNALNDHMPVVIVAPLSTKIKNYKGRQQQCINIIHINTLNCYC